MLGQALALRLRQGGHEVTILEAAPGAGGLAGAWTVGEVTWDIHYHVILPGDARLLDLLAELGLSEEIAWVRSQTGFFANGQALAAQQRLRLPAPAGARTGGEAARWHSP